MNSRTSSAQSDLNRSLYVAILLGGVSSAFALSWLGYMNASLAISLSSMAVLAVFRYQQCQPTVDRPPDGESLEIYAEQIYLLGYLLTIAAIVGVVLQANTGTGSLLRAGAVKLVTTIAGLLIMFWFKERAHGWAMEARKEQAAQDSVLNQQLREAVRGLISETETLRTSFGQVARTFDPAALATLANGANEMARVFRETAGAFPNLQSQAEETARTLRLLDAPIQSVSSGAEQLGAHLVRAQTQAAGPLTEHLQALAGRAEQGTKALGAMASQVAELERSLQLLAQGNQSDQERLAQTRETFQRLGTAFEELQRQLSSVLNSPAGKPAIPLSQLLQSIQASARGLETMNQGLSNATTQLVQSAIKPENLLHVAEAVRQLASTMEDLKNGLSSSAGTSNTEKLLEAMRRFEVTIGKLEVMADRPAQPQADAATRRWFGFGR